MMYQIDHEEFKRNLKKIDDIFKVEYITSKCGKFVYVDRPCQLITFQTSSQYHQVKITSKFGAVVLYVTINTKVYKLGDLKPAEHKLSSTVKSNSTVVTVDGKLGNLSFDLGYPAICHHYDPVEYDLLDIVDEVIKTEYCNIHYTIMTMTNSPYASLIVLLTLIIVTVAAALITTHT